MPVSVIEIKRSLGSKGISSSVAACCQILPGDSILTASAVTRATPTSCAAWDFSHETSIEVTNGRSAQASVLIFAQNSTALDGQARVGDRQSLALPSAKPKWVSSMDPEHWQQIKILLHSALEHAPVERPKFLDQVCSGDPTLRSQLEALLASHERTDDFIETPAF